MGQAIAVACALAWLAALTICDVRDRRLPNALTLPGAAVVLLVAALAGRGPAALLGAVVLTALYLVVHLISPAAMGAGDVKLAIGVGALTGTFGVEAWVLAALAAPLLTATWGIVGLPWRGAGTPVPHGPSMCVATMCAVALVVA
ncbi:A24 family peptidase [Mycolicibacterium sp.]|uniref:prepilin peptidase n=1 Tax=Mycolicibacterium sp. TaxID=2320850 RepID=UPI001A31B9EB|nr:A24 family peptidase [Mycolicibacterium sp.]MBJ7338553.1 prepilin peptidase [Mycolicibacterium sp.]